MNDFIALGVLPGVAGIFGLLLGGPVVGFIGLFTACLVGLLSLYIKDESDDRIEKLEREVEELRKELDDEE